VLPDGWPVHRHCALDSWSMIKEWADWNENVFFGFTNAIDSPRGHSIREMVRRVPSDRILLETDAPYHCPDLVRS
jgi:Tat protein secretion system quality control protein TatD with DNase activity